MAIGVITFPNAAALVIARMRVALPTQIAAGRADKGFVHDVPNPRPDVFVRIFRTGGPKATLVTDAAQLTIESWAPDADIAATNAELVRAHVNDLPGRVVNGTAFYLVEEMSGPAELPDPISASRRFTWTASVHVRGT